MLFNKLRFDKRDKSTTYALFDMKMNIAFRSFSNFICSQNMQNFKKL